MATITSVVPRAFMPMANAVASCALNPAQPAPNVATHQLAQARYQDQPDCQLDQMQAPQDGQIDAQAGHGEEDWREQGDDQAAQLP